MTSPLPPLPSGLLTFIFTDIVGSTAMKAEMPGRTAGERQAAFAQRVKAPHDALIIELVREFGGAVVKSTGDGFLIVFSDAELAVLCAIEIQRRIADARIFTPNGVLQIRAGVHSGQAVCAGNDYVASAVDKAARVESKAATGTVCLSRETNELVRDKVRGVSTRSHGQHDLKGVATEELFIAFSSSSNSAPDELGAVTAPEEPRAKTIIARPDSTTTFLKKSRFVAVALLLSGVIAYVVYAIFLKINPIAVFTPGQTTILTDPDGSRKEHWKPMKVLLQADADLSCTSFGNFDFVFILYTDGGTEVGKCGIAANHQTLPISIAQGEYFISAWKKGLPGSGHLRPWDAADSQGSSDWITATIATAGGNIKFRHKQ